MKKIIKRWQTLDAMKALLVSVMIFGHTIVWWYFSEELSLNRISQELWGPNDTQSLFSIPEDYTQWFIYIYMLLSPLIMSLPITAGMALYFSFKRRKKWPAIAFYLWAIIRASIIFILGMGMNYLAWGKDELLTWDVLPFYAVVSLFLSITYRVFSQWIFIPLMIFALLIPSLAPYLDIDIPIYLRDILFGDLRGEQFWPVFPWSAIVIVGYFIAYIFEQYRNEFYKYMLYLGGFFIGASLLICFITETPFFFYPDINNVWGRFLFQPPLTVVLAQIGLFFGLTYLLQKYLEKRKIQPYSVLNCFSHGILWIYLFNIIIGLPFTMWLQSISFLTVGLWISIIVQFIIAYFIGFGIIKYKERKKIKKNKKK